LRPVLRWISALGIAVTVANWSVTIDSVPCSSVPCSSVPCSGTASSGAGARWIGLGALIVICGSWMVCAETGPIPPNRNPANPTRNARTAVLDVTI
jgi:hypothetical protein